MSKNESENRKEYAVMRLHPVGMVYSYLWLRESSGKVLHEWIPARAQATSFSKGEAFAISIAFTAREEINSPVHGYRAVEK